MSVESFVLIYEIALISFVGLCVGSFATALTWRVPRNISWTVTSKKDPEFVRSKCTKCDHELTVLDLFPVLSWLFLKGRCRHCKAAIGYRYLIIELVSMFGCLGAYFVWGMGGETMVFVFMVPFLVSLLFIDLEFYILPNELVLGVAIFALITLLLECYSLHFSESCISILMAKLGGGVLFAGMAWGIGLLMTFLLKKDSLGFGDVKFFGAAGLWLGAGALPFFMIVSGFAGVLWGAFYIVVLKKKLFPFGPALIITLYIGILLEGLNYNLFNTM